MVVPVWSIILKSVRVPPGIIPIVRSIRHIVSACRKPEGISAPPIREANRRVNSQISWDIIVIRRIIRWVILIWRVIRLVIIATTQQ